MPPPHISIPRREARELCYGARAPSAPGSMHHSAKSADHRQVTSTLCTSDKSIRFTGLLWGFMGQGDRVLRAGYVLILGRRHRIPKRGNGSSFLPFL